MGSLVHLSDASIYLSFVIGLISSPSFIFIVGAAAGRAARATAGGHYGRPPCRPRRVAERYRRGKKIGRMGEGKKAGSSNEGERNEKGEGNDKEKRDRVSERRKERLGREEHTSS